MMLKGPIRLPLEVGGGEVVDFEFYFGNGQRSRYLIAAAGLSTTREPLLRIESACIFGHVFRSRRCDCGFQLRDACDQVARAGGLVIYGIDEDGRGLGIEGHFETYLLRQRDQLDTADVYARLGLPLDSRDYADVAAILRQLSIDKVRVLTNNPKRLEVLERAGIACSRVSHETALDRHSAVSMMDKASALDYMFSFSGHASYLRQLATRTSRPGADELTALLLENLEHVREISLPIAAPAAALSDALRRPDDDGYRILYLVNEPPEQWTEALTPAAVDLIVFDRDHVRPSLLELLRSRGLVVDTVDLAQGNDPRGAPAR